MGRSATSWKSLMLASLAASLPLGAGALLSCDSSQPAQESALKVGAMLGPDEIALRLDKRCPGASGCEEGGDDRLLAGVAKREITPLVERFSDTNGNGRYDEGEPFVDSNKNGIFDAYYLAGFETGRLAYGVHDPVWARAVALRQNQTTVVLVAVDAIGLFAEETAEVQKLLDPRLDIDLLLLHATHVHQNADLIGSWGPEPTTSGIHAGYKQLLRQRIAEAVTAAVSNMTEVRVSYGSVAVEDGPQHDLLRYVSDTRDPVIIDNTLHTIHLLDLDNVPPKPLATIVNWAHHPEAVGAQNHLISSDFVHFLREEMEQQGAGMVVYVSGALGGRLGSEGVAPIDPMGQVVKEAGFKKAELIGRSVARFALASLSDPGARTALGKEARLRFMTTRFPVQLANRASHAAKLLGVYTRQTCCYDESRPIADDNLPKVETSVAYLELGPAAIITNPGELLPELFLGGYGGEHAGTYSFIDFTKDNAPNVAQAPRPPYLIDLMGGERPHRMTFGLTMDFLGPIVPRYNFVLDEAMPYFSQAKGDHVEEMHSLGPLAEPQIVGTMRQLVLSN